MQRLGRFLRLANVQQQLRRQLSVVASSACGDALPDRCDVLIIGGGGMGASSAYWLKCKTQNQKLSVLVVERDACYTSASTVLSVGGVRQQFSLAENIQMSLFGYDFISNGRSHLGDVDLNFQPHGYLILASDKGADTLSRNSKLQNELGACNELLSPETLRQRFPWLSTEDIALGCYGTDKEGWFDPWALLMGFKKQAREYGAQFANGEVNGFEWNDAGQLSAAVVSTGDGQQRTVKFDTCVLAAGAQSGQVARLANIGTGQDVLQVALPVEPRKRYVYVFNTQGRNCPGLATPLTIDPDGTYFRRDGLGGNFLCGRSPADDEEPECDTLDVDHGYFESNVWPTLASRVPAFESVKVQSSWAGYYDHNSFDANGVIGRHPHYKNLYIAAGFSGHGIQQAPAVGRAISELILEGKYKTLDLSRLGFERLVAQQRMLEVNIV
ncbi:FAD-dependent oxidoreductase domain-containing protein 1 [Drosophila sulfurigaster albostrigata]|uniref:FAD-dependent oxidoreductase domain-containing protein 1 n=1 Tax=Drosophila sulfurigaster albostrigata TaxID=89887 RepID=UPI002D21C2BD|nr:FAD-dependent oxidoreductase domain-containing protein 1 [Drosophila sulfurigaster albostrigata]